MYHQLKNLHISYMKENPFTFCHDGSSDNSTKKMNPVCDINTSMAIETRFYDICVIMDENSGKAEELFGVIKNFSKDAMIG